jgi:autophagy-related protein 18
MTGRNELGLGDMVEYEPGHDLIALPSKEADKLIFCRNGEERVAEIKHYDVGFSYIAINYQGSLVAKASLDGKYIRVFKFGDEGLEEVKRYTRGRSSAEISSLVFNQTSSNITCSSKRDTIHMFTIPKIFQWSNQLAESA